MKSFAILLLGGCLLTSGAIAEIPLIPKGATDWKYLDSGEAPGEGWSSVGFDHSGWKSGMAPLGYETDGGIALGTEVGFGGDEDVKHAATYFRRVFEVENPNTLARLLFKVAADDGATVHLNGQEIHRLRMPEGEVSATTFAAEKVGGSNAPFRYLPVEASALVVGKNVMAISVHQSSATSSDLYLNVEFIGLTEDELAAVNFTEKREALLADYETQMQDYVARHRAATTDEERAALRRPDTDKMRDAMMTLVMTQPKHPEVVDAAHWLFYMGGDRDTLVGLVKKHHADAESVGFAEFLTAGRYQTTPALRDLLQSVHKSHPKAVFQAIAAFTLSFSESDSAKKEALLVEADQKIGDFKIRNHSMAKEIKGGLFEMRHLSVGKVAPEIEGEDIDGENFKLSDYRGKVVLLDFWGHW